MESTEDRGEIRKKIVSADDLEQVFECIGAI
jgi:hypothetical protein